MSSSVEELTQLFSQVGFEDNKVKEIVKNKKVSDSLYKLIKETPSGYQWNKSTRALVHNLASFIKGADLPNSELVVNGIINGDLKTSLQAVSYTHLDVYKRQTLCKECVYGEKRKFNCKTEFAYFRHNK